MVSINPKKVVLITLLGFFIPAIIAFFFFTRYNYIPVQLSLGSCQMDYTAGPTYSERLSPLVQHDIKLKGWDMMLCYGEVSLRNRKMIGDRIPYNEYWRFGANEPTRFYTTADVRIGSVVLPKGRYSLYAKPGRFEWEIFVNRSISHWGNDFSPDITKQMVGSFIVKPEFMLQPVETLSMETEIPELGEASTNLIVMFENTRLSIPIENLEEKDKTDNSLRGQIKKYSGELNDLESTKNNNN